MLLTSMTNDSDNLLLDLSLLIVVVRLYTVPKYNLLLLLVLLKQSSLLQFIVQRLPCIYNQFYMNSALHAKNQILLTKTMHLPLILSNYLFLLNVLDISISSTLMSKIGKKGVVSNLSPHNVRIKLYQSLDFNCFSTVHKPNINHTRTVRTVI